MVHGTLVGFSPLLRPRRLAVLAVAGMAALGAALVDPALVASGPVLCPFRRLTGLPCPGCGLTRSAVALAHGDLAAAVDFHPLGPALLALVGAALLFWLLTGRAPRVPEPALYAALAVIVGTSVVRLWLVLSGSLIL